MIITGSAIIMLKDYQAVAKIMQDLEIYRNVTFMAGRHKPGGERSVFDLLAAKGYPTLLFAPHFYNIALEMI
jgi:hypothetical protein